MKLYIGDLPYQLSPEELTDTFKRYGNVTSVKIIKDWESGQSKGFAFVEMPTQVEAEEALKNLNGSLLNGKNIKVNIAKDKRDKPKRGKRY